jgi:acetyl esterase/lipase
MTRVVRYDPELEQTLSILSNRVPVGMTLSDTDDFRALYYPRRQDLLIGTAVECSDYAVTSADGTEFGISVFKNNAHGSPGACVFYLHGGGMIMGNRFVGANQLVDWAANHNLVCVTPEYRLAPGNPAPAQFEDCLAALHWIHDNARKLDIDSKRIVICGGSGGGGLAAGLSLFARDQGGPRLLGQMLQSPMIDDRNDSVSARQFDGVGVWNTTSNRAAWKAVLGNKLGSDDIDHYWAPARADDLSDLPPTFIDVGAKEVVRDEAIAYAMGIMQAGGQCELHVWAGAYHGFYDLAPESAVSKACIAARTSWLLRVIAQGPDAM